MHKVGEHKYDRDAAAGMLHEEKVFLLTVIGCYGGASSSNCAYISYSV